VLLIAFRSDQDLDDDPYLYFTWLENAWRKRARAIAKEPAVPWYRSGVVLVLQSLP
jgi:hypothetical protein